MAHHFLLKFFEPHVKLHTAVGFSFGTSGRGDISKEGLIQGLNEDLAAELGTVIRYNYQASKAFGFSGTKAREIFREEGQDKINHATFLFDAIVDLEGEPTTAPKSFDKVEGLKAMLELDIQMEIDDVKNYIAMRSWPRSSVRSN